MHKLRQPRTLLVRPYGPRTSPAYRRHHRYRAHQGRGKVASCDFGSSSNFFEELVERTQRSKRDKAARGQVVGIGRCPYGYQFVREYDPVRERSRVVGLAPDPTTAPIAQRIWRDSARISLDAPSVQLNLVMSRATAKRGSPTWQALAQGIQQADTAITQLERERTAGAPRVLPGLSPDQATALADFAATVRQGIPATTPSERREILQLLGWGATVYYDPQGVTCGRHPVRIEWTSRVPLPGAQLCIRGIAS